MVTRVTVSEYACLIWYYHLARVVLEIGHLMPLFFDIHCAHSIYCPSAIIKVRNQQTLHILAWMLFVNRCTIQWLIESRHISH